jgi:homoserine acetyltransferase
MREKTLLLMVLWLVAVCAGDGANSQSPQSQPGDAAQQFATLGEFKLQSGDVMHEFRIGYRTLGRLNADKSNAVL